MAPWSTRRAHLRIEARARHRHVQLPERYFDAAHTAADALRDAING